MQVIRILIVDDDAGVRRHLEALLESQPDMCVAGAASDIQEAIAQAAHLAPDVVLMDIRMEEMGGLRATRFLRSTLPSLCVVALSAYDLPEYREAAVSSGASGYVAKRALFTDLLPTIRAAVSVRVPTSRRHGGVP